MVGDASASAKGEFQMQVRSTVARALVLSVGAALATSACGQYSLSNIRALKAFKEANGLYSKKEYKGALEAYNRVLEFNPEFSGITYFFIGNSNDYLFKPAKKGEPENDAYLTKAIANYKLALEKIKDTDQDAAKYRKLSYEWLIAAYGVEKLNDLSQAEPIVRRLMEIEPNEPRNYQQMAKLYEDAGRMEDAEAMYRKAIDLKPNDAAGYEVIAGFYFRQGRFEDTMDAFNKRANLEPNNPEAWHTIATYYQDHLFKNKRLAKPKQLEYALKGIEAEDKALALNPEYTDALFFKNILLLVQAGVETNPAKREALTKLAGELREKGLALQKKQAGDAAATASKKGGGGD